MKIMSQPVGAILHAAAPARPVATTAKGRFEALLAGGSSREATDQRALGFGELGVFARPASTGAEAPAARPDDRGTTPWAENADGAPHVAAPAPPAPISSPGPLAQRLQACADAIRAHLDQATSLLQDHGAEPMAAIASPVPEPLPASSMPRADDGPAPELARRPRLSRPAPSQVSLVLAEDGGGLKVVAAGFPISPALGERLRQRISDLAVEHGLTLSELLMNGQSIDAPSFHVQGAIHGDHAR